MSLPPNLSREERLQQAGAALLIVVVFLLAEWLVPNPEGFGTHQQLRLPGCLLRGLTGTSCPHCGLTTSFCWLVRGEFRLSMSANPSGMVLALGLLLLWPLLVWSALTGRKLTGVSVGRMFRDGFAGWLILTFFVWLVRFVVESV